MTWEEFGNFHYGYTGAATGIPKETLIFGSEYAHGVTKGNEVDYNEETDQNWISIGIDIYNLETS